MADRLLRLGEVKHKVGLGTTAIKEGIKDGWFPKPLNAAAPDAKRVTNTWSEFVIDDYVERRKREAGIKTPPLRQRNSATGKFLPDQPQQSK
jgi:predicted DNA-binding transcriptional regulator AlpA